MREEIKRMDPGAEFYTEERCFINELLNSDGDPALSIARARVAPGTTTRWHRLCGIAERYVILAGAGIVEIGELPQAVNPGDVVCIPPACRQRIRNPGTEDLIFLAICTPRFSQQAYEHIDVSDD